ncbi:MAG TPA: PPC domain-containing protein, partial [Fimbriiglobus sp.]|nr:PPC domain-containing protein [Fimbriiglobus sp.]
MRRMFSRAAALAGLILGPPAAAQPPQNQVPLPRITAALPCGAQAGTTVEVAVSGTDLDDATALLFSHPAIIAAPVADEAPNTKAKEAKKPPRRGRRQGGTPATVRFRVTVPAEVPVGQYDVRVVNRFGVSNPRAFVVGDRPEVEELEPNDDAISPDPTVAVVAGAPAILPGRNAPRARRIELGTTVNGVIGSATDVDYVVFTGKAGQRVLGSCLTSSIDSRARPLVELYDPAGRRLGMSRNYKDNDALLEATLPADGDYFVRVSEFAYQEGGPDYFYRLTVGTGPWIDAVFPPAVNPNQPTRLTLTGRNLPGGNPESLTVMVIPPVEWTRFAFRGRVPPPMGLQDAFEYRLVGPHGASNAVPIFLTDAKVVTEKEGNDTPESAQPIPVPGEVAGRIGTRDDRDFYRIAAKKGDVLAFELIAEQNGSASDLFLQVRNEKGQVVSPELDDDPEPLHPVTFFTRNGDPPAYRFTAPADGKYVVFVGGLDADVCYGPRCFYRLRVTAPRPDFRAVVMARSPDLPAAVTARPDGEVAYDVYIHRTGGFTDPVTVTATSLPPGVTCRPALVGSRAKWGTLVLSCAAGAKEFTGPISVTCSAAIAGKQVVREARPASITWGIPPGQNVPTVTRLDQELVLAVRPDRAAYRITADLSAAKVKTRGKDGKEKEQKATGPLYLKPGDKLT